MESVKNLKCQRAASRLTIIVFGTIIGTIVFCAYNIMPFFYYYYDLVNQFESVIRIATTETDKEIQKKLWYQVKSMQIPCIESDLKISRDGDLMRISLKYSEVFAIDWQGKEYIIYVFPFHAYAEGHV